MLLARTATCLRALRYLIVTETVCCFLCRLLSNSLAGFIVAPSDRTTRVTQYFTSWKICPWDSSMLFFVLFYFNYVYFFLCESKVIIIFTLKMVQTQDVK